MKTRLVMLYIRNKNFDECIDSLEFELRRFLLRNTVGYKDIEFNIDVWKFINER